MKDLYQILGVKDSASADEIKKAYREHAKKLHPDKTGGDKSKETRFKDISAAYDVLSDPKKRAEYDEMKAGGFNFPGGGPNGGRGGGGPGGPGMGGFANMEDLLAQMFGGGMGGGGGGARRVIFETEAGGSPFGGGRVRRGRPPTEDDFGGHGAPVVDEILRTRDGVEFTKRGDDLYVDVPIGIDEAVLGAKVPVPTLDGQVTMTIPPGTSSGKKLRLRGKGYHGRGDQYAVLQIVVPDKIDDKARDALKDFVKRAPVKLKR